MVQHPIGLSLAYIEYGIGSWINEQVDIIHWSIIGLAQCSLLVVVTAFISIYHSITYKNVSTLGQGDALGSPKCGYTINCYRKHHPSITYHVVLLISTYYIFIPNYSIFIYYSTMYWYDYFNYITYFVHDMLDAVDR
jgi:hypothetical protein